MLLLMLAGVADFGSALYSYHVVQTGLQDAARHIARAADPSAAEETARRLAVTGSTLPGRADRLSSWQADDVAVSYRVIDNPPDPETGLRPLRGGPQIRIVDVSTTLVLPTIALHAIVGEDPFRIALSHQQRVVGQ